MSEPVKSRGMSGKDVITVGIFSAIYFVINFVFMLLGGLHPLLWILMPGFIALFTGIPYLMMCAKVQKVGSVLLMGLITGLIYYVTGQFTVVILVSFVLACGLAEATLDTMINGGVMENAVKVGEYFRAELRKLQEKHAIITEVRGMGMINGAELANNEIGPQIVNKCFEKKVLINCTAGNVLRFIPPLIATEAEIDVVVKALDEAMTELGY